MVWVTNSFVAQCNTLQILCNFFGKIYMKIIEPPRFFLGGGRLDTSTSSDCFTRKKGFRIETFLQHRFLGSCGLNSVDVYIKFVILHVYCYFCGIVMN